MPRTSNKERYRREIFNLYIHSYATRGSKHPKTRRLLAIHGGLLEERYIEPRVMVPKSDWATTILPQYSDSRWRSFSRMSPESFKHIASLIEGNNVFHNNSTSQQASIKTQLKIALWRLANDGSSSGYRPSASQWGVSEGHIFDCTKRVVAALF